MKPYNIFVIVQPGLEDIVEKEINALGYRDLTRIKGGFFLWGHLSTVIKLNIACRCITRVLIDIAEFEANSFAQLEKLFNQIPWKDYISDQNICIHVSSYQSGLYHEKAIAERLINSLADVFGKTITVVGSPDEENTQLIVVYVKHDRFTVRMDTSGAHLHKRGYGIFKEEAPLRETLACALLYATGWGEKYIHLCDPMCGSGTIPIEAALMSKRIPWSEFRTFAFQKWSISNQEIYEKIRAEFMERIIKNPFVSIIASDVDGKAINSCTLNSQNAGLNNLIPFEVVSLDELSIDKLYTVITNPPWGKRLGIASIDRVWLGLGSMLSKGQDIYMLLPDMHETDFSFSYTTLLRFTSGDINVKFVKVKEKI